MGKPILFSGSMVKAILEDRKTQTRRLNGLKEINKNPNKWNFDSMSSILEAGESKPVAWFENSYTYDIIGVECPYVAGMILWVRETWSEVFKPDGTHAYYMYKADEKELDRYWRPSIFMPRVACRIRLKVTDVRVERLQEITEEDAIEEGIPPEILKEFGRPCGWFKSLWNKINAKRGFSFESNPWVFVVSFEKQKEGEL